jgi:hypothetical protein
MSERFARAVNIGVPALVRLRAEAVLERNAAGAIPLTAHEREEVERIAVAPQRGDQAFLHTLEERDARRAP